jgi:hypothetical protein
MDPCRGGQTIKAPTPATRGQRSWIVHGTGRGSGCKIIEKIMARIESTNGQIKKQKIKYIAEYMERIRKKS